MSALAEGELPRRNEMLDDLPNLPGADIAHLFLEADMATEVPTKACGLPSTAVGFASHHGS
jgi:hypothetical protein